MITSPDNPRVKDVLRLRKSRERRRLGLFIAEGPREVERARGAGLRIVETYFAPELLSWDEGEEVTARVLAKMAYRADPEGVLAVMRVGEDLYFDPAQVAIGFGEIGRASCRERV